MTSFQKLEELRSVARARAAESFEYFVSNVCGLKGRSKTAEQVQKCIESDLPLPQLDARLEEALHAWLCVLGRRAGGVSSSPSEVFDWLFCEEAKGLQEVA